MSIEGGGPRARGCRSSSAGWAGLVLAGLAGASCPASCPRALVPWRWCRSDGAARSGRCSGCVRSGRRWRFGRNLVGRPGRRHRRLVLGRVRRFAVGLAHGRRRVRRRFRDLGKPFHRQSLQQNRAGRLWFPRAGPTRPGSRGTPSAPFKRVPHEYLLTFGTRSPTWSLSSMGLGEWRRPC